MIPFNLEQAQAGKPFGRMENGKFIKATHIHVVPDWCDARWPVKVLFEDGEQLDYTKQSTSLCMQPRETVCWSNVYETYISRTYNSLKECNEGCGANRIAIQKTTIIGKEVKTEIIYP